MQVSFDMTHHLVPAHLDHPETEWAFLVIPFRVDFMLSLEMSDPVALCLVRLCLVRVAEAFAGHLAANPWSEIGEKVTPVEDQSSVPPMDIPREWPYLQAIPVSALATCLPQALHENLSPTFRWAGCGGKGVLDVPSSVSANDARVRAYTLPSGTLPA